MTPTLPISPARPRASRLGLMLTLAFMLGGCAMLSPAPDLSQRQSSVQIPETWSTGKAQDSSETSPQESAPSAQELAQWWQQLQDPLLNELVEQGLAHAPDLHAAQARVRQARATRDLNTAGYFPSLSVSTGAVRSWGSQEMGSTGRRTTSYNAGFDASWEPDIFGATRSAVRGAEADLAARTAQLADARVTLVAEIARNYVEYRANQERLDIAQRNAESQQETLDITQWRAMAGLVTQLDVEQARTSLEQTRAGIPSLASAMATNAHRLDVLLGVAPGTLQDKLAVPGTLPQPPQQIATGIPTDTLRRRPDVQAAEQTLLAETARVDEKVAARYPSLSLGGSFGWQALTYSALGSGDSLVRSLTASLAAPLFDGGRIRSQIEVQDAVQEQALVSYEQTLLTALEDVENALSAYSNGRTQEAHQRQAADAARNAALLASQMYQAGLTDFQNVLQTQRTLLTAEDSLVSSRSAILTSVVQLYKALGGGWEYAQMNSSETQNNE